MKRALLILMIAVLLLSFSVMTFAESTDAVAQEGETQEGVQEKKAWQIYIEEKLLPTLMQVASFALSAYLLLSPIIKKIVRSCSMFDGAAGDVNQVSTSAKESAAELEKLRSEVIAMTEKVSGLEESNHELLKMGVRMMALAFSHEPELVKNGTAREIMKVVERHEENG